MHPPPLHSGRLKGIWHTCLSQKQVFLGSTPRAATKLDLHNPHCSYE